MKSFFRCVLVGFTALCLSCAHNPKIALNTRQVSRGIHAGMPALPYFVYSGISLRQINAAFKNSDMPITLADTYNAAYHVTFSEVPEDGDTGHIFADMKTASQYLQKILKSKKVSDFQKYLMTGINTASADGYILIASVYRKAASISVFNKFNFLTRQTLTPEDPKFFRAYRFDVKQQELDRVYGWAALPVACLSSQAHQAVLLTLAANDILHQKSDQNYWREERQWIAGNYDSILIEQDLKISQFLGIENGFTQDLKIRN